MDQKYFRGILKRYLQGRATAEEEKIIDSWYADMGRDSHSLLESNDESELEDRYWSLIDAHIRRRKNHRNLSGMRWYSYGIAASVLLALLSYFYLVNYSTSEKNILALQSERESIKWQVISNTGIAPLPVRLPDHSTVTLEPKSELKFSASFDESERAVYLAGEGFFEVSPDQHRPFLVYANKVTTKVLGTSFRVRAFQQDKNVTVAVKTGKVSVYTREEIEKDNSKTSEIILTPNQQIIYDKEENKLSRMIVEKPQAILPPEEVKRMRFEAAPVTEIFHAIEKVYGVDLVFDQDHFSACTLTSVISDGGLYNRLDIICKAIGATYSLRENQILIHGTGCNYQ